METEAETRTGPNRYRHILVLLFVGYLLSFADRIVFGLVLKPIKAALLLSDSQAGLLVGAVFAVAYAGFSPAGGFLIDRCARRPIFAFAIAFWSVATFSCGLAGSFLAMVLARTGVGAGEALLHPLAVSLIGDTVPSESRAKAFAVYFSAGTVGTVAALLFGGALFRLLSGMPPLVLPLVGVLQPWQVLFMFMALPGLLLGVVVLAIMREPPRHGPVHDRKAPAKHSAWAFVRANPGLATALFIGFPLIQMAGYTFLSWVFIFFDRVHGWPPGRSGVFFALTGGLTFIAGCLLSGHIVGLFRRRGYVDASLRSCILGGVAFSAFAAAALLMPSPYLALAFLTVALFFGYLPTVCGFSAVSEVVPPPIRAGLAGVSNLANGLIVSALGPFLVGFFSDHFYPTPTGIRWAMLTTLAVSAVGGTAGLLVGLGPFRRRMAAGFETETLATSDAVSGAPLVVSA